MVVTVMLNTEDSNYGANVIFFTSDGTDGGR